jgi:hypothetical protein
MSDEPDPTPEERFLAAVERAAEATGKWLEDAREALQPFLKALQRLAAGDPEVQARVRRRAEEDHAMVSLACDCQCEKVHPDAQVCDLNAVTTIRDYSGDAGPVDVPVCAPCAAEVMARPQ